MRLALRAAGGALLVGTMFLAACGDSPAEPALRLGTYVLTSVNGAPLPFTVDSIPRDAGQTIYLRIAAGVVRLSDGGRAEWSRWIDGTQAGERLPAECAAYGGSFRQLEDRLVLEWTSPLTGRIEISDTVEVAGSALLRREPPTLTRAPLELRFTPGSAPEDLCGDEAQP